MADLITLRPELLAYRNQVVIDGVVLYIDVEYRSRTNDWFVGLLDAALSPIVQGVRVQCGVPLFRGTVDERLPPGFFLAVREGDSSEIPRAGELGAAVKLTYVRQADVDEVIATISEPLPGSLLAPAAVKGVT